MQLPLSETLLDDAGQYSAAAVHLVQDGMYSLDGVTPYFAREPGMSVWLAAIYAMFGIENRFMVFILQATFFLIAGLSFVQELSKHIHKKIAELCFFIFICLPPLYHVLFSLYREGLALSLAILFMTCTLRSVRTRSWVSVACAGALLGALTLTYTTFLLLPVILVPLLMFYRIGWKKCAVFLLTFAAVLSPWAIRNTIQTGSMCLTGCNRAALQWYVRGVQTRDLRGLEPLRCLYSEYISRNWDGRSDACSFNAVMHRKWPDGFKATPEDARAIADGRQLILSHIPNYMWLTFVEIIELHLPYVNGWGFWYNLLSVITMICMYIGILGVFPLFKRPPPFLVVFMSILLYHTAVFALTDATPRYLLPVIFCYVVLSGLGYSYFFSSIRRWNE